MLIISVLLSFFSLLTYLLTYLSIYLSIYVPALLSIQLQYHNHSNPQQLFLSVCLSVRPFDGPSICLSIYVSTLLSIGTISSSDQSSVAILSDCLSIHLYLSVCKSVYLSIYLCIYLIIHRHNIIITPVLSSYFCLSVCLSIHLYLSVCQSVYLSIYISTLLSIGTISSSDQSSVAISVGLLSLDLKRITTH